MNEPCFGMISNEEENNSRSKAISDKQGMKRSIAESIWPRCME
jgi:hypothetical protein